MPKNNILDRSPRFKRDPGNVGASIFRLADQLRDGLAQARRVRLPFVAKDIENVLVVGMGGSHLGADMIISALSGRLEKPVHTVNDYEVPGWVNARTLVVCSSYSGNTEESVAALRIAHQRKAKIVVLASGGALAREAKKHNLAIYHFAPTENPSGQPRLGVAYGITALLVCWKKLGVLRVDQAEFNRLPVVAWEAIKRFQPEVETEKNAAKQLALAWAEKVPMIVGAPWANGNMHTFSNQIHENAKTYAAWNEIPELNHHLMEGLRDKKIAKQFHALFIEDFKHFPGLQKRFTLTKKIFRDLGMTLSTYKPRGGIPLNQAIDLLAFSSYASWYLSIVKKVDPAPIPTVDYLKKHL